MESNSQHYIPRIQAYKSVGGCGRNYCDDSQRQHHDAAAREAESPSYRPELSNGCIQDGHAIGNFNDAVSNSQDEPWDGAYAGKDDSLKENYDYSNYNANDIVRCERQYNKSTIRHDDDVRKSYENNLHNVALEVTQCPYRNIREEDEVDLMEHSGWPFIDIEFNRIQHPRSIDFENEAKPMLEVSFPLREHSFESSQNENQSFDDEDFECTKDDCQSYDDVSQCYDENCDPSVDESSLDSDNYPGNRRNIESSAEPIFHSSDSLNVIQRIESVMESLIMCLDRKEQPILRGYVNPEPHDDAHDFDTTNHGAKSNGDPKFYRNFCNIAQSRSVTSICLVISFIHQLLLSNRTTTTREVFYVFVTHFRNQRECDGVILDVAKVLGVSRRSLGLFASPKGWFCGCVEITRRGTLPSGKEVSSTIDGTAIFSIQGLPITKEWTERDENGCTDDGVEIKVYSKSAKVILVIEKEGVYNRLSEERIFDRYPCILVTGKGNPDLATRALVSTLHRELRLPVAGICDCNPFGISVLALYHCAGDRMGVDGRRRYTVPIRWLGLRPSKVARLKNKNKLPESVFQKLTDLDNKRIASLLDNPEDPYLTEADEAEVRDMKAAGYKVELEALYWIGPDYMGDWVVSMLNEETG
jgi:meiotic recombination protein SPO11